MPFAWAVVQSQDVNILCFNILSSSTFGQFSDCLLFKKLAFAFSEVEIIKIIDSPDYTHPDHWDKM